MYLGSAVSMMTMVKYRKHRRKTWGRASRVGGSTLSKGPPQSERSFGETVYSSTDHFLGYFNKFRQGRNLSY